MKTTNLQVVLVVSVSLFLLKISVKAQRPELIVQTGHSAEVLSVSFSSDGKTLASGSNDKTIRLWDAESGKELRTLTGQTWVTSVTFSLDGKIIASAAGTFGKTITLWDAESGKELQTLSGHSDAINSLTFSPDGKILASASADKTIKLWDIQGGKEIKTLTGHADSVSSVSFRPDGKTLASGSDDKTIKLWDVANGTELKTLTGDYVSSVTFNPDGKTLAFVSTGQTVTLWDFESGKELHILAPKSHSGYAATSNNVYSLAFSPDGKILASGAGNWFETLDDTIKLWDVASGKELKTLTGHRGYILSLAFSPDGKKLASGSDDKTIKLWDAELGKEDFTLVAHSSYVSSMAFSADGKTLAKGSADGRIKLWDLGSGEELRTLAGHAENLTSKASLVDVTAVAFSPDGKSLASGSADKTIRLWDVKTGKDLNKALLNYSGYVHTLIFSPDGRTLASANEAGTINVWDLESSKHLEIPSGQLQHHWAVSFSPDGKTLAFGSDDKSIKFWDAQTGKEMRRLSGHTDYVDSVSFSPDGKTLASGSLDKTIKLWDVRSGKLLDSLDRDNPDTEQRILKLFPGFHFSRDEVSEKMIARDAENVKIKLFDRKTEKELVTLITLDENDWLVTTPEGFFDGTPNAWKQLLWRFNNNTFDYGAVELYFNDFFYPNLLQAVIGGKSPIPKAGQELEKIDRRQPKVEVSSIGGQGKTERDVQSDKTDLRMATMIIEVADNADQKKQPFHKETSGAQDLRLFRNGSLVRVWHDDVFKQESTGGCEQITPTIPAVSRRVRCKAEVPIVEGDNVFTAYAFNSSNVKSNDSSLTIKGADALKRDGTLYVLAIGVNKYAQSRYDLNFAVPDVVEIGQAVEAEQRKLRRSAQLKQYARTQIITLTDESATKENILLALRRFAAGENARIPNSAPKIAKAELAKIKQANPEDALVIYYAGHGTAKDERFYLLPHDFAAGRRARAHEEELRASSVSDLELNEVLERVGAGRLLMVIDACQSGQALGAEQEGRGPMNSKGLAQLAYDKGMYILTAAQSYQAALEVSRSQVGQKIEHGLLTFALLEGLRKARKDNEDRISERNWMNFAVEQVPLMQIEEMKKRSLRNKQKKGQGRRGAELVFVWGDKKSLDPEKRNVQRPRVFYRRELETHPLIIAKQ